MKGNAIGSHTTN